MPERCHFDVVEEIRAEANGLRITLAKAGSWLLSKQRPTYADNLECCQFSLRHRSPVALWFSDHEGILDVAHAFRNPVHGYQDCPYDQTLVEVWFQGGDSPEVLSRQHPRLLEILRTLNTAKQNQSQVWRGMRAGVILDVKLLSPDEEFALLRERDR